MNVPNHTHERHYLNGSNHKVLKAITFNQLSVKVSSTCATHASCIGHYTQKERQKVRK